MFTGMALSLLIASLLFDLDELPDAWTWVKAAALSMLIGMFTAAMGWP